MSQDTFPPYLEFYNAMLQMKRAVRRMPPPVVGLSHFEFMSLTILDDYCREHPDLPGMKVSLLGQMSEMSRPALSQHINNLEKKGMVTRIHGTTDRRVTFLHLTEKATLFLAEQESRVLQNIRRVCDLLEPKDTEKMIELIHKMLPIFNTIAEENRSRTTPDRKDTL